MIDRLDSLYNDNGGVSPVIGVILMVAVTVIIAAVIGSAALGLGDEISESPPSAQVSTEQVDDKTVHATGSGQGEFSYVEFEHTGGDEIDLSNVKTTVNGDDAWDVYRWETEGDKPSGSPDEDECRKAPCHYTTQDSDGTLTAGDTIRVVVSQSEAGKNIEPDRSFDIYDNDAIAINGDGGEGSDKYVHLKDGAEVELIWETSGRSQVLAEYDVSEPVANS